MKLPAELLAQLRTGAPDAYRVAADLLLEQGDPRGPAVAAAASTASRPNPATRRETKLVGREVDPAFVAPGVSYRLKRGFIDEVTLKESDLGRLPTLLSLEPITALRVQVESGAALAAAMMTEPFLALSRLTVTAGAPVLRRLTQPVPTLRAFFCRAPLAFEADLSGLFPSLEALWVTHPPDDGWLEHWAAFPKLRRLSLPGAPLREGTIRALVSSSAPFEVLDLGSPASGSSMEILRSRSLTALHTVSIGSAGRLLVNLGLDSVRQLGLPSLRHIRWHRGPVKPEFRSDLRARRVRISGPSRRA